MLLDGLYVVYLNVSKDNLFFRDANTLENDLIFENESSPQELLNEFHLYQRKHSSPHPMRE
jgi:hypothetical protein